jgi:iron-sulfur cluster assembly accessory protein
VTNASTPPTSSLQANLSQAKPATEKLCSITPKAAQRLTALLAQKQSPSALRIAVIGGGCSGLQYQMHIVETATPKDYLIETQGIRLLIDSKSALYISGSTLDYSDDLQNTGFIVTNPNAASTCSCGKSFSV